MVQHFTFVQLPAVLTGWGASWVLLAVATGAVAVRTAKAGIERPDQSQVLQVGSGPNPLKCQPFVVLYRMDRAGNGDGVLDPEEIPRGAESFVQRLVTESKVASPTNTPLRQMAIAWHRRTPRSTGRLPKSVVTQPDRSRAPRRESMASHRDRAASFLGLYDRNGNGSLEQDEWNRIGAGWDEGDVDGNGALSLDELSDRFMAYERPPSGLGNESAPPGSVGNAPEDRHLSAHAPRSQAEATPSRHRKSYRRRTPHERLPTGIPGWYIQKDADRDGQIMMVEFAKAWNDEELAEFNRYDFNRDGIITPRECLKAKAQR